MYNQLGFHGKKYITADIIRIKGWQEFNKKGEFIVFKNNAEKYSDKLHQRQRNTGSTVRVCKTEQDILII